LLHADYKDAYPECHDPGIDHAISYSGPFRTVDTVDGLGMTIGEALASPTRTYAPVLKTIYAALQHDVHGTIHLTGGAHTKILRFARGKSFYKDSLFPTAPIFRLIQEHGKVEWEEMYKVFNMGQRMELYVPESRVAEVISISASFGIEAKRVGYVDTHPDGEHAPSEVVIASEHGSFSYRL
jgi:phosphoribosylformylglycinamidine cyclo-ligase